MWAAVTADPFDTDPNANQLFARDTDRCSAYIEPEWGKVTVLQSSDGHDWCCGQLCGDDARGNEQEARDNGEEEADRKNSAEIFWANSVWSSSL